MVFDEYAIFGGPLEKPFPVEPPSPRNTSMNKPEIVSGRARAKTVDISTVSSRPSIVERYSSAEESPKIGRVAKKFDVDAMLSANITKESSASIADSNDMSSLTSSEAGFVVDSKNDFLSSLRATLDSNPESSSSKDTDSMTSAKPLMTSKRRWKGCRNEREEGQWRQTRGEKEKERKVKRGSEGQGREGGRERREHVVAKLRTQCLG